MFPNFQDQEFVLTNLITLKTSTLQRGDVIVFASPTDADKDFIKRVVGLPGDSVMVKDGMVYVNNERFDESHYLKTDVKTYGGAFLKEGVASTVQPGEYFALGDNRPYSSDSREWGGVPMSKIIGKSMFIYWPMGQMRAVTNPFTN